MSNLVYGIALSIHLGLAGNYNEVHPYARYTLDNNIIAGAYYNSEEKISAYIGYEIELSERISVDFGVVSGYSSANILPMSRVTIDDTFFIAPTIEYDNKEVDKFGVVIGIQF